MLLLVVLLDHATYNYILLVNVLPKQVSEGGIVDQIMELCENLVNKIQTLVVIKIREKLGCMCYPYTHNAVIIVKVINS